MCNLNTVLNATAHANNIALNNNTAQINAYIATTLKNCYSNAYKVLFVQRIAQINKANTKRAKRLATV